MSSAQLKRAKRQVRRRVIALREAIAPEERDRLAASVTERFLVLPEVEGARTVMVFWSFGSELSTGPLLVELHARGKRVALPRIVGRDIEARGWAPGDPMGETSFGALEPLDGEPIRPSDVDVVAAPAVAFDRSGGRVGYGSGFYDRFLLAVRDDALVAGIGFGVQLLDEPLPGGAFDRPVDVVVTDLETVRCGPRR